MCDDGNVYRTGGRTSALFDASDKGPFQQFSGSFQSPSLFSGIDTDVNIISHSTSANSTIAQKITTNQTHSQRGYFGENTIVRNHEENGERQMQCGFEAYYDSHENQNQSCKLFETSYVPHNIQVYQAPENMLLAQHNGRHHQHEICSSGFLKQSENSNCIYSGAPYSASRNSSSEFYKDDSLKSVTKAGSSINMLGCSDMIHEDEINDMLKGYLGSYNTHGEPKRVSEGYKLPPNFSTSINIPQISDKTTPSNIVLETRPSSVISSSSVVSPSSTCETVNSDVTPYDANQSPSQLSNDSGFSGDYSRPLSIHVPPPFIPDTLEHNVYNENCEFRDKNVIPIQNSEARLLQQVQNTHIQSMTNQPGCFHGNYQNISGGRKQTGAFLNPEQRTAAGYHKERAMNGSNSSYNGCENYLPSEVHYYKENNEFKKKRIEDTM